MSHTTLAMSNERYNYSISLIRRRNNSWVIEPKDATSRLFATELSGKKVGDGYLASKIEGELSYCIFLSGVVCHSDVYGWIITMNGWQILELDTYLQLAQEVWNELAQTEIKERDIRQLLYDMAENKELIPQCVPVQMSRNVVENTHIHPFTPTIKPPEPILKKLKKWQPEVVKVAIALVGILFFIQEVVLYLIDQGIRIIFTMIALMLHLQKKIVMRMGQSI